MRIPKKLFEKIELKRIKNSIEITNRYINWMHIINAKTSFVGAWFQLHTFQFCRKTSANKRLNFTNMVLTIHYIKTRNPMHLHLGKCFGFNLIASPCWVSEDKTTWLLFYQAVWHKVRVFKFKLCLNVENDDDWTGTEGGISDTDLKGKAASITKVINFVLSTFANIGSNFAI